MVLRNCIVLALVALLDHVIATPHGYGVKGGAGAVAKAEASASAGAFSGLPPIPIPIPNGAGFSGSYSKSSSSSFASSSASASSSSSSFSFSGSGANVVNGLSGGCSTGACGCATGACQNNGANDLKTSNNVAGQSEANNNQRIDCSSGQCDNKQNLGCTGADCATYANKDISSNCKSGNCGQTNSPNDIYVNIPGRSTQNPEESFNHDIASSIQNLPSKDKPSTFEPECNSYDCISPSQNPATDDKKRPSSYDVPIFGTTLPSYIPDRKEPCTSSDCLSNGSVSSDCTGSNCGTSNSVNQPSYNTPDKASPNYFSSTGQPNCEGPNCDTSSYPSTNLNTKQPSKTFKYPGDCGTLGCGLTLQSGVSNNENKATATGSVDNAFTSVDQSGCNGLGCSTPSLGNGGVITKQPYFSSPGGCGPSGCGSSPKTDSSYSHNQPNYQNSGNPSDSTNCQGAYCGKPSYTNFGTSNVPAENCGPSGCTPHTSTSNIPSYNQPGYGTIVSSSTPAKTSLSPSQGWSTQSTVAPSSSGYTSSYSSTSYKPASPVSSPNTELVPPNQNSAVYVNTSPFDGANDKQNDNQGYTSGYSSSSIYQNGVTKPNQGSTFPSSVVSSNPSYFPSTPQYSQNTNKPVNGFNVKPIESPKPDNNKQLYTGGFGAPKGPIDQGIPAKPHVTSTVSPSTQANISPANIPSVSPYQPANSGSYNQNPVYSSPVPHVSTPQIGVNGFDGKPLDSTKSDNNKQLYTGGFGAPKGPIDQGIPAKPHVTSTVSPSTQANISPANIPSASPYQPANSGSYNKNPVHSSPGPHVNTPQLEVNGFDGKPFDSTKPDNNKQLYTGGFGAPKGPVDQGIPAKPHVTSTVSPSTQANISPANIPSVSPYQPANSGSYNKNPIQSSPGPHATITKDTKNGTPYHGGFGAPSGYLKPNDYSIPAKLPTHSTNPSNAQPINVPAKPVYTPITGPNNVVPCSSNNCESKPPSVTNNGFANAHAQATASAVAYTGGFGGPSGFLKPYDDGKVPTNGNANGNPSTNLQGSNVNFGYSNTNYKNNANDIHENGGGNTGAVAQANAVATSSAGAYGLSPSLNGGGSKGCSLGCGAPSGNGADSFSGHNYGINAGAVASAKSVAGAGSYGAGGSFASSSASSHASAGAAVKGGYGRR